MTKTLQDVLLDEGLQAVHLAAQVQTIAELQARLTQELHQNSQQTRRRYVNSVTKWFFPDGLDSLARRVWMAYEDEALLTHVLRYQYLAAEPIMGDCVAQCLYPLEEGMVVPSAYFERYLRDRLGEAPWAKTLKLLKMNLAKLGFLDRSPTAGDRLCRFAPDRTAILIVLHALFAPAGPRTVELAAIVSNPFWKYMGLGSEQALRAALRAADGAGLLGKYVVADQLEQITTCWTLAELLGRRFRL